MFHEVLHLFKLLERKKKSIKKEKSTNKSKLIIKPKTMDNT